MKPRRGGTAATTTPANGWSVSRLAAESLGDRRALTRPLKGIELSGRGPQNEPLYRLSVVVHALSRRAVENETARLQRQVRALENQLGGGAGSQISEGEARRRKRICEAALLELELGERRGELVPLADIEFGLVAASSGTAQRLTAVPAQVAVDAAAESEPALVQEIVARAIHEALEAISSVRVETAGGNAKLDALLEEYRAKIHALLTEEDSE